MSSNTIGKLFTLTCFGESHGPAIGGVIDGCPSKLHIDMEFIKSELKRRSTNQSNVDSQRNEADEIEFLSGLLDGVTLGTPIAFIVRNIDSHSDDYEAIKDVYRPSHADFTYQMKYGIRDWRGGGRASARNTLPIVVAGAIAKQMLKEQGVAIATEILAMGDVVSAKKQGDTVGGIVKCVISNLPAGLGEPLFDKFQADLAKAMFSIPAVKGFEYGDGFDMAKMKGSECNDTFVNDDGEIHTLTNHSGGIQGGITNGADVNFKVAFKPIPSLSLPQETVNEIGEKTVIKIEGRHDVCALPRALVIVESLAAMVSLDHLMMAASMKL